MEETQALGHLLGYCDRLKMVYGEKQLRQAGYDVTPVQSHMLIYLSRLGEGQAANQRGLEHELRLRPSTVNGIVSRLEEKGYVSRRPSPADGRCRLVVLTEAGQQKVNDFYAIMHSIEQRFLNCLSAEEQASLRDMLSRIIENLENEVNKV